MKRTVENDRGEKIGTTKDLAIDPDNGRIVYAVLSFGGFLGMGDKLFAIPPSVLQIPGTGSVAVISVDKEQLKNARGFDKSHWPNLADPTFVNSTYEFYGQKPYRANQK
jgi:sporulation protein YlmC with PRC-barrel domain